MTGRRRVLAVLGVGLVLFLFYGFVVEPRLRLDLRTYDITIPGLDPRFEGERIAVFSDLQIGMWWANEGMVDRVVERTIEAEPGAVLLVGDFVYSETPDVAAQVDTVTDLLDPLFDAGIPTYAVMGNHDYEIGAVEELTDAFEERGVTVLSNGSAEVPGSGSPALRVVGIGPERPGMARPEAAFDGVPADAPRVVMMHNPMTFTAVAAHRAPLAVAGHTHCGQIAVPFTPRWSYMRMRYNEQVVVDGFAPTGYGAEGNQLFVTCGIGFSLVPMRFSAPPQLAFFELVAGDGRAEPDGG